MIVSAINMLISLTSRDLQTTVRCRQYSRLKCGEDSITLVLSIPGVEANMH